MRIKLMSFNLRCAGAPDGVNNWEARRSLVIERIRAFDPDLIGLQECEDNQQAVFIRQALPDYGFFGVHRSADPRSGLEMTPALYRRSAFELVEQGNFWLSAAPETPGSLDWGAVFARTVCWLRLRTLQAPRHALVFFNTHFDYAASLARLRSAQLLRRRMHSIAGGSPFLLSGDFNAGKQSGAHSALLGSDLQDALDAAGVRGATFHDFGRLAGAERAPNEIDWIAVSRHFSVLSAMIDRTRRGEVWPSDHYPLGAVLNLLEVD